jgi:hypothetical protein
MQYSLIQQCIQLQNLSKSLTLQQLFYYNMILLKQQLMLIQLQLLIIQLIFNLKDIFLDKQIIRNRNSSHLHPVRHYSLLVLLENFNFLDFYSIILILFKHLPIHLSQYQRARAIFPNLQLMIVYLNRVQRMFNFLIR